MNQNTLQQFFELVRSGLWGRTPDAALFSGGADWNALLRMASMQSLTGIFADGASALPKELMPPAEIARKLFVTVESVRRANLALDSVPPNWKPSCAPRASRAYCSRDREWRAPTCTPKGACAATSTSTPAATTSAAAR